MLTTTTRKKGATRKTNLLKNCIKLVHIMLTANGGEMHHRICAYKCTVTCRYALYSSCSFLPTALSSKYETKICTRRTDTFVTFLSVTQHSINLHILIVKNVYSHFSSIHLICCIIV